VKGFLYACIINKILSEELNLGEFKKNLRAYFFLFIAAGVGMSLYGTFAPSDLMFIIGMMALVTSIGIGAMDFQYKLKDKRKKDKENSVENG